MSKSELPAPDAAAIHVHTPGGTLDPMSRLDLKAKVDAGEVSTADQFWFAGMGDWVPAETKPEAEATPAAETKPEAEATPAAEVPAEKAAPTPEAAETSAGPAAETEDDRLDAVFGDLVQASWDYFGDHDFASHVDEVFLGAIITSSLDINYSLIDLTSDGTHHYLRFENMEDHSRFIVRFTHLTADLATARVLDHRANMVIGYGEKTKQFQKVWKALKAEYKSGLIQGNSPGTFSVDGDLSSQYVYVQVPLFMRIDDYVARDYTIDFARLGEHLGATTHALRKYLRGRFA